MQQQQSAVAQALDAAFAPVGVAATIVAPEVDERRAMKKRTRQRFLAWCRRHKIDRDIAQANAPLGW
jgi:uncharacterized protein YoaH (UPF0181 family)